MDRVGVLASLLQVVCFVILIVMLPLTTRVYAADYQATALMAFKEGLIDPTNALSTWNSTNVNPCVAEWTNIRCDPNKRQVEEVNLKDSKVSGSLVAELGNLANLTYLVLGNNSINGTIPKELGNLSKIVVLDLGNNSLTGSIPQELGHFPNLRLLLLNDNKLSGNITGALAQLPECKVNWKGNPGLCGLYTDRETC